MAAEAEAVAAEAEAVAAEAEAVAAEAEAVAAEAEAVAAEACAILEKDSPGMTDSLVSCDPTRYPSPTVSSDTVGADRLHSKLPVNTCHSFFSF